MLVAASMNADPEHALRLAELECAALAASRAGVVAGDAQRSAFFVSPSGSCVSPFPSPMRTLGELTTLRASVTSVTSAADPDLSRGDEWQASLPLYSRIVFSSAPYFALRGGGGDGMARASDVGSIGAPTSDAQPHTPSHCGSVAKSLPGWLMMTLKMSQAAVRALFMEYEVAGVGSVPMGEFADALGRACGLELTEVRAKRERQTAKAMMRALPSGHSSICRWLFSHTPESAHLLRRITPALHRPCPVHQIEMSTLLHCLAPARGEEPPPLHMSLPALRRLPLDVGLLGRAIQFGEKRSASEYLRRGSVSPGHGGEGSMSSTGSPRGAATATTAHPSSGSPRARCAMSCSTMDSSLMRSR